MSDAKPEPMPVKREGISVQEDDSMALAWLLGNLLTLFEDDLGPNQINTIADIIREIQFTDTAKAKELTKSAVKAIIMYCYPNK